MLSTGVTDPINHFLLDSSNNGYDKTVTKALQTVLIENGRVEYSFTVSDELCNIGGNLHGGAIATLIDMVTSFALITGGVLASVSVDLNTTYLVAAPKGSKVHIEGSVTKIGKTLCFSESTLFVIKHGGHKVVIAKGRHTKFIIHGAL